MFRTAINCLQKKNVTTEADVHRHAIDDILTRHESQLRRLFDDLFLAQDICDSPIRHKQ